MLGVLDGSMRPDREGQHVPVLPEQPRVAPHHETHELIEGPTGKECYNCWGCECHSPDILKASCLRDVR